MYTQSKQQGLGATLGSAINQQIEMPVIGDRIQLVFYGHGGCSLYQEGYTLNPQDRLVEVSVESIKKIKVEFELV